MSVSEKLTRTAVQALKSEDENLRKKGVHLLVEAAKTDQINEDILLLLSAVFPKERKKFLIRVLQDINPGNAIARYGMRISQDDSYYDYIVRAVAKSYKVNGNTSSSQDIQMKTSKSFWQRNFGRVWQGIVLLALILTFSFTVIRVLFASSGNIQPVIELTRTQQQFINLFTWSQITVMFLALLGLIFFKAETRQKTWSDFEAAFGHIQISNFFWFIFALVFLVLGGAILLLTWSAALVGLIWLVAWWFLKGAFYRYADSENFSMRDTIGYLLSLMPWYIFGLIFYIILATIFNGNLLETIFAYAILALLYLGAKFGYRNIKGQLADDLFLATIIFTIFEFLKSFYLREVSASMTILGAIVSFIFGGRIDQSVITPILNGTFIEYFLVSIFFLMLLNSTDDNPQLRCRIPASLLRFSLNFIGIVVVGYAIGQTLNAFYIYEKNTFLIVSVIINLLIAMIGVWVLILVNGYLSNEDMVEENDENLLPGARLIRSGPVHIKFPPYKVLDTLRKIKDAKHWTPGLEAIKTSEDYLEEGSTYDWVYKWWGAEIRGRTEILTLTNDNLFEMRTEGKFIGGTAGRLIKEVFQDKPILTLWRWKLKEQAGTTQLTLTLQYTPSSFLLTPSINSQAKQTLKSLKSWIETGQPLK